jgi:hypothetical protein
MENILRGLLTDAESVMKAAMVVMAIWFAMWTWIRTKSLGPTLGALVLGAIVVWGVGNVRTLEKEVNEDLTPYVVKGG